MQVQQRHLPHVAGERVRAAVLGPGPVQVPAQVAEQPPGRRVVLHAAGLADDLRVGLAQRGGAAEAGEQDPHLGGVQRRRCLVTVLQRVEQLGAQQLRQPGQGELVHPEPGLLAGHPGGQLVTGQRGDRALAAQPLVVEAAQPAAGDALPVAAGDPALRGPGQRPGPGDERRDRLGPVLAPGSAHAGNTGRRSADRLHSRAPRTGPRRSGRVARGGGAASNSAQHRPGATRARRQPSQRPDGRRVAVGHPGVRHGHAAVRALTPGRR